MNNQLVNKNSKIATVAKTHQRIHKPHNIKPNKITKKKLQNNDKKHLQIAQRKNVEL